MPEVGEVRYKAKLDTDSVEKDIKEVEKTITEGADKTEKKVEDSAKKASEKVIESAKKAGDEIKKTGDKTSEFADALGKVKDGPIGQLNKSIGETKTALSGVNSALSKTSTGFNAIGLSKEKVRLTNEEISQTKEKLKELKKAQNEAKDAFKAGEISKDTYKAISREVMETKSDLKELKKEGREAYKELANTTAVTTGISKIGTAAKAAGSVGMTALKGIGTAFAGLTAAAGAGVVAVAKMGIEYNAQMQSYQTAFTTMLGDAEKAQKLTDNLKTLAAKTPLAMTDLADASQILLAFGSTAEQIPDQLKRLGDVAQGDAKALGTMATAFGRIQSNGYASLEEINMMIDQGFNPLQIIAEKTGESMAEVRERVSAGEVSFEELSDALVTATSEGGQFFNAMENQSKTFEGQMSTLQDNVSALAGSLTEDLFAGLAETALPLVNGWVDQLLEAAETDGVEGAIDTAGVVLGEALSALLSAAPSFIETATSLVGSFLGAIQEMGPDISDGAIEVCLTLIDGFVSTIPQLFDTAGTLIVTLLDGLTSHAPEVIASAGKIISNIVSGLINNLPEIIKAVGRLVGAMLGALGDVDWVQVGKDLILGIINGVGSMGGALWDAAKSLARGALDAIRGAFDSHSPSKAAERLADTVPQGIVKSFNEDKSVENAAKKLGTDAIGSLTFGVDYNMPDLRNAAKDFTADFVTKSTASARIEVPVILDGREIARASAWYMGEQLAWEERR